MMRASQIFIGTVLFFGLFTGGQVFMNDLWTEQNVQTNTTITVQQDYEKMQKAIDGNNNSLRAKMETLSTNRGGILDAASAGLLLVPQLISDVLAVPFTSLVSTIGNISSALPQFFPQWATVMFRILVVATVAFSILSLALGVKS